MENNITSSSLNKSKAVDKLRDKYQQLVKIHLRNLLSDKERNKNFTIVTHRLYFDYSHEKLDSEGFELLLQLAEERNVLKKFNDMLTGVKINSTEKRRVLHSALRLSKHETLEIDGVNVVKDIHEVLERIKVFSNEIRSGKRLGFTDRKIKNFISIGIGGSYLGGDFVFNSFKTHPDYEKLSDGFQLRFLANVCPIDFKRAVKDIDFEETLFIIISKTFTTAETMLNARNCKSWLLQQYTEKYPYIAEDNYRKIISKHFCAVSTNIPETDKFGIEKENVFGFWDWVGGRYSVWSAVGALPLSLTFGFDVFNEFLKGGRDIDRSLEDTIKSPDSLRHNVPIVLGLIGFWNTFICDLNARAILPYSQALCKFPSHIQQLDMESNGKSVSIYDNKFFDHHLGAIIFGEPGTNGQHSFYQLIHQGRPLACEFIAHAKPQQDVKLENENVSNHEELMCNFFAQPDALAYGKFTSEELKGIPEDLVNHKTFKGNRPSCSLLLRELDAFATGQLLAIYEHRVATEGFLFENNSFDQWGVELGKVLANDVRRIFTDEGEMEKLEERFNSATANLIRYFSKNKN